MWLSVQTAGQWTAIFPKPLAWGVLKYPRGRARNHQHLLEEWRLESRGPKYDANRNRQDHCIHTIQTVPIALTRTATD